MITYFPFPPFKAGERKRAFVNNFDEFNIVMHDKMAINNHKDKIYDMHYGSNSFTFRKAEELRKRMTKAEIILWEALRNKKLRGLKFRRQHPLKRFIVDFYCHKHKLVIELDGSIHELKEVKINDQKREEELSDLDLNIIRFKNEEVICNLSNVLEEIVLYIETISENPPPQNLHQS